MLYVLYWLFYTAAFGSAALYAAYKGALVQRTLAAAVRRGLRGLVHDITDKSEECTVTRTESGIRFMHIQSDRCIRIRIAVLRTPARQASGCSGLRVERASVASSVLAKIDDLYINLTTISVRFLEVSLPTMFRPLIVTLHGVNVELMQRTLPQVNFKAPDSSCNLPLQALAFGHV